MNFKFETIVQIFRKIMQLNAVNILKSLNEYYREIIPKSGRKMALYPAMYHSFSHLFEAFCPLVSLAVLDVLEAFHHSPGVRTYAQYLMPT